MTRCDERSPLLMPSIQTIHNARLPNRTGLFRLEMDAQGTLQSIVQTNDEFHSPSPISTSSESELDVQGDWISLGGVDLQINGALGLAFPDLDEDHTEKLVKICQFLWHQGIDGFLPTLVTTSVDHIHRALSVIATVQQRIETTRPSETAKILGVHLEGPCLNPEKRGAHPQEHLQPLTIETIQTIVGNHGSVVKVITLAPELDATGDVIPYVRSLGITVSLGHSQATADEAKAAFQQGATMITHAFNAMPSLHHRKPGLLGAALTHPGISCGLIADGQHVCPTMLDMLMRINRGKPSFAHHGSFSENPVSEKPGLYEDGIFLVSDALSPLGLPDGTYPWDTREIHVEGGTARLDDGTLAGTTHPLLVGAHNLVRWGICEPDEAIALATIAPRHAIGLSSIEPGHPVHLLRWSYEEKGRSLTWQRIG
ncbi:MAG: N-acetylglucosamine-6-phosphate deacetylase [Leptolyngbyaceae bacterium]|nr:N-acetylglucosamine-6-phosphate deacetylase [Leptolyngbyaceae bacterium]